MTKYSFGRIPQRKALPKAGDTVPLQSEFERCVNSKHNIVLQCASRGASFIFVLSL